MEKHIRVLGIASYEGMKIQILNLVGEYPQIDLTVYVGDLGQGLVITQNNLYGDYDVVISHGATAQMLRQHLAIPVTEIDISVYDIFCAIRLASRLKEKTAIIFLTNVRNQVLPLCDLSECDMDIYTVDTAGAAEPALHSLQEEQYHAVSCDAIVSTTTRRLRISSFPATSGIDSIRNAFHHALLLCDNQQYLWDENLFFQELIRGQIEQTVVFDSQGDLFLSTLDDLKPELLKLLREELSQSLQEGDRRISHSLGGMLYSVHVRRIRSGALHYTTFFFDAGKLPASLDQVGIRSSSRAETKAAYYNSIFSFAGNLYGSQREIGQINQSTAPVTFTDEDGTGKGSTVHTLYIRGPLRNNPLIFVNRSLLNDRGQTFLMEHHNSLLADKGSAIYFTNVDVLSRERQYQLVAVLTEIDVRRRDRVMFPCACQSSKYTSRVDALFQGKFSCLSLYLMSLRQTSQQIPTLVNLCLSRTNVNMPRQILGADPESLSLLQGYHWPHSYTQSRRVTEELVVTSVDQIVIADNVRRVLRKERHVGAFSPQERSATAPLDLSRTLIEISQDIAVRVADETGGNHTAAAEYPGISRTTL